MNPSILNKVIVIEKAVSGTSQNASPTLIYSEYMTTYAGVYVRSNSVRFDQSEQLVYNTEFTIRYNNDTKVINNKYRIKYDGNYYSIIEIIEVENKQTLRLICQHFYGE